MGFRPGILTTLLTWLLSIHFAVACTICNGPHGFLGRPDQWPSPGNYNEHFKGTSRGYPPIPGTPIPNYQGGAGTASGDANVQGGGAAIQPPVIGSGAGTSNGQAGVNGVGPTVSTSSGSATGQATASGVGTSTGSGTLCATYGVLPDGCTAGQTEPNSGYVAEGPPTANANTVQHADFFTGTYARQSGQTWVNTGACSNANCHPGWNVPGVDYPVGINAGVPLQDPTTASLPAGCTYCPLSGGNGPGCPYVTLANRNEVECVGQASYDIEGYDFSLHSCVALTIEQTTGGGTGILTVKNNKFIYDTGCYRNKNDGNAFGLIDSEQNDFAAVNIKYNYIDMNGYTLPETCDSANGNTTFGIKISGAQLITLVYNVLQNSCTTLAFIAPISGVPGGSGLTAVEGSGIALYNYFDGVLCKQSGHCHILEWQGLAFANPPGSVIAEYSGYNAFLSHNGDFGGTAMDWTDFFSGPPAPYYTVIDMWKYNNLYIGNTLANDPICGGQCLWDAAAYEEQGAITHVHYLNNYIDPTGPMVMCLYVGPWGDAGTPTFDLSGNVDMLNGSTANLMTNGGSGNEWATQNASGHGGPCN